MSENNGAAELTKKLSGALVGARGSEQSAIVGSYWHEAAMALVLRYRNRLVPVGEMARVQYGKDTRANQQLCRQHQWRTINMLNDAGVIACHVYGSGRGSPIVGIKVLTSAKDLPFFRPWWERVLLRKKNLDAKVANIMLELKARALTP